MHVRPIRRLRVMIPLVFSLLLAMPATSAQAECSGCICPGDPCRLCPLPPMKNIPPAMDEPETCLKIREKVPPISASPGTNEHFASQDKATMECVKSGGDIIRNHRRTKEFPSKLYCKPYVAPAKDKAVKGAAARISN
jgi:hypothetical protein